MQSQGSSIVSSGATQPPLTAASLCRDWVGGLGSCGAAATPALPALAAAAAGQVLAAVVETQTSGHKGAGSDCDVLLRFCDEETPADTSVAAPGVHHACCHCHRCSVSNRRKMITALFDNRIERTKRKDEGNEECVAVQAVAGG